MNLLLHPPLLPYGYTLHHRFARIWELASYLRSKGHRLVVMDAGLLNHLKGEVLAEFCHDYDSVLVYCENQAIPITVELAERCRAISPRTRIFAYGPGPVCFPELLRSPALDGVGRRGDLEAQARQFLERVSGGTGPFPNVSLRTDEVWTEPEGPPELVPPSEWGFPDLDEMPMQDVARVYAMKHDSLKVAVTASKGCPYPCTFCHIPSVEGVRDRRRDPALLADFVANHREYPEWQFYSPTFTLDRDWCLAFFEELSRRRVEIGWKCTTRVDRLDADLVHAMARSGCRVVGLGVETLGPARRRIKKGITDDEIAVAIHRLTQAGIVPKAYVMLGLPGQRIEDFRETVAWLTANGAVVRPYTYMPQGEADGLRDELLIETLEPGSGLNGRSQGLEKEHFGEFLRLAFGGYAAASRGGDGDGRSS